MNGKSRRLGRRVSYAVLATLASGCAGTTVGSGVGDTFLERAPWRAGRPAVPGSIVVLPIGYQVGAAQEEIFDPPVGPGTGVATLVTMLNESISRAGLDSKPASEIEPRGRPDVQFSCETDAFGDCEGEGEVAPRRMRLAVTRASPEWTAWVASFLERSGATHAVSITLEVGQYWPRQRNLLGAKEIELSGTHRIDVPWLTALDRPVMVLQLTGALIGPDGKAARIAAEGLLARRTNLLIGSLGAQALITDEEVEKLANERREDLPGRPLVLAAAVDALLRELGGGEAVTESR